MDDGSSPEMPLSVAFLFFGRLYQSIYVSLPSPLGTSQTSEKEGPDQQPVCR